MSTWIKLLSILLEPKSTLVELLSDGDSLTWIKELKPLCQVEVILGNIVE
jgi:hypothetical protein